MLYVLPLAINEHCSCSKSLLSHDVLSLVNFSYSIRYVMVSPRDCNLHFQDIEHLSVTELEAVPGWGVLFKNEVKDLGFTFKALSP